MDLQQLIVWAFALSMVAMVFAFGLATTIEDVRDLLRQRGLLGRSLLAIFVIAPVVAVILARAFDFPHAAELAVVALAISPLPPLIPRNLLTAAKRAAWPAALMAAIALLSIVIVPLLAALIGHYLGPSFAPPPSRVAGVIAITVLLPLAAGMAVCALRPALADRIELSASVIGTVVLRLATLALLVTSLAAVWALIANGMVIAIAVLVLVGLAAGHLLGGSDPDGRTVLALTGASRHPAVVVAAAAAGSLDAHFGAAIVLYLLLGDLFGLPYTMWRQRTRARLTDAEAAAIILRAREQAVDNWRAGGAAPYYVVPPEGPEQSNGAMLRPSAARSDAASTRGAAGDKQPDNPVGDSAMGAVLAHLVGW